MTCVSISGDYVVLYAPGFRIPVVASPELMKAYSWDELCNLSKFLYGVWYDGCSWIQLNLEPTIWVMLALCDHNPCIALMTPDEYRRIT